MVLAVLAGSNLVGGLLMYWYLLAVMGPGSETDALFASLALPQVLLAIIASSFINVLVPILSGESELEFRRNAWTFAAVTFASFVLLASVLAVSSTFWVPLLAPGLAPATRELASHLARIQLIGMVCTSMAGVLTAVHRARRNFYWVEIVPLIATVVAGLTLLVFLPRYGVYAAAWAWVMRIAINAALLVPGLGRFAGFTRDRVVLTEAWRRIRPLVIGTAYMRTEPLFDRGLVSLAPVGDLSLYYLCQQVCFAAIQLANNALIAPLAPTLATQVKDGEWPLYRRARRRSLVIVGVLAAAAFGALWLVTFVGGRAHVLPVSAEATIQRVTWLLAGLAGVFIAGPMYESLRSAFYSTGNTATPIRLEVGVYTGGLALKAAGFALFGVHGLAVAASLQAILGVSLTHRVLSTYETRQAAGASPARQR